MNLCREALKSLQSIPDLILPKYIPEQSGIIHFGVGAFHRSHQALYTQLLMDKEGEKNWGITGVGIMTFDKKMNQVLTEQNFLYTLVEKPTEGKRQYRIISSVCDHLYAVDNWKNTVQKVSQDNFKIITLTITEGGYFIDKQSGEFDFHHNTIKEQVENWKVNPKTIFGYLAHILETRRNSHGKGITILSCDNIQHNGRVMEKSLTAFLEKVNPQLLKWVKQKCSFPNSMVDRITPQTNPADLEEIKENLKIHDKWPVVCQDFKQWVVEDKFVEGRPAWQKVGVQFVENVSPYEKMKLRILNGSHQAISYLGHLKGFKYVDEAAQDKQINEFTKKYLKNEVVETLDPVPGINLQEYQNQTLLRFCNQNIKDTISRICEFTSDRIPLFNVPSMIENVHHKKSIPLSAMVVASWIAYVCLKDNEGKLINIVDNRKVEIQECAVEINKDGKIKRFVELEGMFGELAKNEEFVNHIQQFFMKLREKGVKDSLLQII